MKEVVVIKNEVDLPRLALLMKDGLEVSDDLLKSLAKCRITKNAFQKLMFEESFQLLANEILKSFELISSDEMSACVVDNHTWYNATRILSILCVRYVIDHYPQIFGLTTKKAPGFMMIGTKTSGVETQAAPFFRDVIFPFLLGVKKSVSPYVEEKRTYDLKSNLIGAGGSEPTTDTLMRSVSLQTPQCAVRGVGWNASTKAWVASWLTSTQSGRRVSSTFSVRKYGYHQAMKFAIAKRVELEILANAPRRFNRTPLQQSIGLSPPWFQQQLSSLTTNAQ